MAESSTPSTPLITQRTPPYSALLTPESQLLRAPSTAASHDRQRPLAPFIDDQPGATDMVNQAPLAQMFERKWELGVARENQLNGDDDGCLSSDMFRAAAAEFLGTLLLLYNGITIARFVSESGTTESSASNILISFGFGLSVFGLVYVMADVSGANFNPAVSVGLLVGKRISIERFFIYVVAQMIGGITGAGLAASALDSSDGGYLALAPGVDAADAFGGEVLCTFLLVVTVFAATDGEMGRKLKHAGALLPLGIGMAVLLGNLVLIPVDGCSLNPARSIATAVTNNKWDDHCDFVHLSPRLDDQIRSCALSSYQAGTAMVKGDQLPHRHHQVFERKWELGLAWEMDLRHNGNSEGSTRCCLTSDLMRAATAEFLGTLLLLYNGITIARFVSESGTTESSASNLLISFGFGLSVLGLVYVMADVSGANFNPAVSVGLLLGKRISVERFFIYVIAQVLGGISGAGVAASALYGTDGGFNALAPGVEAVDAFGGEVLCTFLLVVTVFAATDGEMDRKQKHTGALLPLSIGMAVLLGNLVMIPLDGCSLNPARSMATAVTNNKWDDHWYAWHEQRSVSWRQRDNDLKPQEERSHLPARGFGEMLNK